MDKNDNETAKEKIDEIWLFVEKTLNTPVPTYIKNILKVCGYNNGISIASIEEEDFTYFEAEVRNGNIGNGSKQGNFLEGCVKKAKDFEFVRGHKKFILFIVDFLKNHLEENGMDSFSLNGKPSKKPVRNTKKNAGKQLVFPWQKKQNLKVDPLIEHTIATKTEKLSYLTLRKSDVEEPEITPQKCVSTKSKFDDEEDLKTEISAIETGSLIIDDKELLKPDEIVSAEAESDSCQDSDEKRFEELRGRSIVCCCGREIQGKEYIDAAISSCVTGLQATSLSTTYFPKIPTIKTPEVNQIDEKPLIPGSYVIYSMSLKNSIRWPNNKPIVKNFVGQVRRLEGHAGNRRNDDKIELLELKNNLYKRSNFSYSENCKATSVSRKNILETLQDPVKNRRGEFVFKDKSLLNYNFD